jgi:ABC-type uncharacterized transport system substrate-binding protein
MRRRALIAKFAGVAAWPLAARAQQTAMPVVGFLASRSPEDSANVLPRFRGALSKAGYIEGRTVMIDYRWARGDYKRLPEFASELIKRGVAVIAAFGPPAALAAKNASSTVPVVFVSGGDPVTIGLVASLNRPGSNVTGISLLNSELGAKRLELLAELTPSAKLIAMLVNPQNPESKMETKDALAATQSLGLQGYVVNASRDEEIEAAFAAIDQRHADALLVGVDPFFNERRDLIVALAARQRIPAIYQFREFATAGGLVSYGASLSEAYRLAASYVGKVLSGVRPVDLPVVQSAQFELVINLKAARAQNITIPRSLLARADEVIE